MGSSSLLAKKQANIQEVSTELATIMQLLEKNRQRHDPSKSQMPSNQVYI